MELEFNSTNLPITAQEILQKISEYDIFRYYCKNFKELDKSFCSELRSDKHPGCRVFLTFTNQVKYRDFAANQTLDCFQYVMEKYNLHYYEALNVVAGDFNIRKNTITISPRVIAANDEFKLKMANIPREVKLEFVKQSWNLIDFEYWGQYGIDFETLDHYGVISAKQTYLLRGNHRVTFNYASKKPRYGYLFKDSSKAYSPYENKLGKWMNDGNSIEGWNQLDEKADLLIITGGLKEVMIYHKMNINAIALPSETYNLSEELVNKLKLKFDKIIVNFDNDKQGLISADKILEKYNINYFCTNLEKDLADYVKGYSLEGAKLMIENKLNEIR